MWLVKRRLSDGRTEDDCGLERDDDLAAERRKLVIFVTGPLFAGKQEYICGVLGWSEQDFRERGVRDV